MPLLDELDVQWSIERKKLGAGGALKKALSVCSEEHVYVMNVNVILSYDPRRLYDIAFKGVVMTVAKCRLPYGAVLLEKDFVVGFREKPTLDLYVSCGHYLWDRELALRELPDKGDLERSTLPKLARRGLLKAFRHEGDWITINTFRDLMYARRKIKKFAEY